MKFINSIFTPDQMGRLGGIVFSKGKYGYYMKTFTPPSNPMTDAQLAVRADFAAITRLWGTLTDFQRTNWDNAAANFSYTKNGSTYTLSGFNFFTKVNRNLQDVGSAVVTSFPGNASVPTAFDTFQADITSTPGAEDITLNFTPVIGADVKVKVYATAVLKPGRKPEVGKLRMIGTIDHTFETADSIKVMYTAKFGVLTGAGQKAMFAVEPVSTVNGLVNAKMYSTAIGSI